MDKQKILKDLDELDMYMFNNLDTNGKFKNINDIQAKLNIDYLQRMGTLLESNEIPDVIKSRYLITKSAYEVANNTENQESEPKAQLYFDYIDSKRNIERNGVKSVQQALSDVSIALHSYHLPDKKALKVIDSSTLTPAERRYIDLILEPQQTPIDEAIKYMETEQETALMVQNERTSFFAKIRAKLLSIFKPRNQNMAISNNIQSNEIQNASNWREQQKVDIQQQNVDDVTAKSYNNPDRNESMEK